MTHSYTDCREEEGTTVGLIDSIIYIARILKTKDLTTNEVLEALKDLRQDEDLKFLLNDL